MRAWKMVDAEHADVVSEGSLLIGTLDGYKTLENGRADAHDGEVEYRPTTMMSTSNPAQKAVLEEFGIVARGNVTLNVFRGVYRITVPPVYVFCMTERGCRYDPKPEKQKAIFRIKDVARLAELLKERHGDKLGEYYINRVVYAQRKFGQLGVELVEPDAFIKDPSFSQEQEIRIVWKPSGSHKVESFKTGPDNDIADLLSRVQDGDVA